MRKGSDRSGSSTGLRPLHDICKPRKAVAERTSFAIYPPVTPPALKTFATRDPDSLAPNFMNLTVGVLALQGAFIEHINLLRRAALEISKAEDCKEAPGFEFTEVRNVPQLSRCDALIIPGGESTTISLVAAQSGLLEPLRQFVKVARKPTWGTCAGLIMLAEAANRTKKGGQELIGGLDVRVNRNHFGRQTESFQANLDLPFLSLVSASTEVVPFPGIFIRAPIIEKVLPNVEGVQAEEEKTAETIVAPSRTVQSEEARNALSNKVEVMGILPGRLQKSERPWGVVAAEGNSGDIIAVRQGNVFGTSFHPELTSDVRIHVWWLKQVIAARDR